ncbi:MAG: hypothetical protein IT359_03040, partial [Gemmatimonadaceae bacterium]|nr:hypothetical protein [Gemmatimonadaceae bacterium]
MPSPLTKWPSFKRTSREYKRGQRTSTSTMSSTAVLQQRQATAYTFKDDAPEDTASTRRYRGISVHYFSSGAYSSTAAVNAYETVSAWSFPALDSTIVYDTTGANGVATVRASAYANPR